MSGGALRRERSKRTLNTYYRSKSMIPKRQVLLTVGYIDIASVTPAELALMIVQKIVPIRREDYLPPNPLALFEMLEAESEDEQNAVTSVSNAFMQSLRRMTPEERDLIAEIMGVGCTEEIPDNIHASLDLIRRDIGHVTG